MIRRVTIRRFKRFEEEVFPLSDRVVLAGANNSGKSTLLQAIVAWKFGLDQWRRHRSGRRSRVRSGVPVTRDAFTPAPLREMNLLWHNRLVTLGATGRPRLIEIGVEGESALGPWACGVEFQYANPELLYVRPLAARSMEPEELAAFPPAAAGAVQVVLAPTLSGIVRDEPRHERGMQDLLISAGRPGEVLRNLLLEVTASAGDWEALTRQIRELFEVELLPPEFSPLDPHITCGFREPGRKRRLDLASAGSGVLQTLLVFAFLYARRGSLVLADEPNAHQHGALQQRIYAALREAVAARNGQLIVATHSAAVLDATDPADVVALLDSGPAPLAPERPEAADPAPDAILSTTDLLSARDTGAVLYVEDIGDAPLAGEWARVLEHRASAFFRRPNVRWLRGAGVSGARAHFAALRRRVPEVRGAVLLGGPPEGPASPAPEEGGLVVLRWTRAAAENYLLHPAAVRRFVGGPLPTRLAVAADFGKQAPVDADFLGDTPALAAPGAAEKILLPVLARAGRPIHKPELHQVAAVMRPEEIHPEVTKKLDQLATALLPLP